MSETPRAPLLGRIALQLKMISHDDLARATREQGRRQAAGGGSAPPLGELMVELELISSADLRRLLRAREQLVARARKQKEAAGTGDGARAAAPAGARGPQGASTRSGGPEGAAPAPGAAGAAAPGPPAQPAQSPQPARPTHSPQPAQSAEPASAEPAVSGPSAEPASAGPARPREATPEPGASGPSAAPAGSGAAAPAAPTAASAPARAASPARARAEPAGDPEAREALAALLRSASERGASDVHVHSGAPPRLRLSGKFVRDGEEALPPAWAERLCRAALSPEQRERFDEAGELDFCLSLPGTGRFRANVYRQQRGTDGVFRILPSEPPTLEALGLPADLARLTNFHQGLVLLTGPANCGKSATLAALVDILNEERREHVLTVEDPIEVLHPSKNCIVNQRSVGPHTGSFARALRAALREDPDVIVIGELRDLETISLALTAAETGHLVLGTLHTRGAIRTLNRIIGVFPADQQEQIRSMVSESLRAVVSQRLVPRADGAGRVPALETLYVTKAVGNLIRENKTFQIQSILQTGASQGMGLLDGSLARLVSEGVVEAEVARRFAEDPRKIGG